MDFLELLEIESDEELGRFVRSEIKAVLDDKMTLEKAVKELYHWQYSDKTDWFTAILITLFNKADAKNKLLLSLSYPEIRIALDMWNCSGDNGNDLFRKYGLMK
jgi:hypothetical protein